VKPERGYNELCRDCVTVEAATKDLCGSIEGYREHWYNGHPACEPCLAARRESEARYRRAAGVKPRPPARCGTDSGYFRHWRRKQKACDDCREAHRIAVNERRNRRKREAA
jgi:hypothetical protein